MLPAWMRGAAAGAGLVLLVAFAYGPLARAGFVGEDYRLLFGAHGRGGLASGEAPKQLWRMHGHDFYDVQGIGGAILPGVSISASLRFWGAEDGEGLPAAVGYRAENLVLLVLAAWLLGAFVRRLLLPWTGSEHARAAAAAGAVLLVLHPLAYAAVATVGGRAPILYLLFGAACAACFLRARQDRDPFALLFATVAALATSFTSEAALGLPVLLATAEFASAHRYRPLRARLRTTLTTFLLCGAAVQVGPLVRSWYLNEPTLPLLRRLAEDLGSPSGAVRAIVGGVEKLGVLCLPVNAHTGGFLGIVAAGVLFLLALRPALRAARTAPRLWGCLIVGWVAALVVAGLPSADRRVHLADLSEARALFASCAVMAVGIGTAATARSGVWRAALPVLLFAGHAALGRVNAAPWVDAARAVSAVRGDVRRAREIEGFEHRVVVLDPPRTVDGVPAVGDALPWVLDRPPRRGEELPEALGLSGPAFLALTREREFEELLERTSLVFPPPEAAQPDAPRYVRLERGEPSQGPRTWSGDARSPDLDWDPLRAAALLVLAPAEAATARPPEVSWRARHPASRFGAHRGAWIEEGERPAAFFDLSASLEWVLGGRIRRVWFEELPTVRRVELFETLPRFAAEVEPDPQEEDWYFPTPPLPEPLAGLAGEGGTWVVGLLDLGAFVHREIPVVPGPSGTLRVPGAADLVAERVRASGGPVAWSLDYREDGVTLARAAGRRIGVSGSREEYIVPPRH